MVVMYYKIIHVFQIVHKVNLKIMVIVLLVTRIVQYVQELHNNNVNHVTQDSI